MKLSRIAAVFGLLAALVSPAAAQAPFYQGKQVTVVVGFTPGGGTDLFGRIIAEGLAKHLEGKPNVIVQNMPGAGSVVASNYYSQKAPHDGTVLLIGTGQLIMRIMLQLDGSRSKMSDFEAVIASPMGRITYASSAVGLKSPKDLVDRSEALVLGVPEVISSIDAVLGLKVLEAKFRPVMGYPGKNDTRLALERGELHIDSQATPVYEQSVSAMEKAGKAAPIFSQGMMAGDGLERDPAAPNVPTVAEVYKTIHGKAPSGPAWEAYKASIRAVGNGGKILMIHADAPPAAREAVRKAADAMKADPEYLKRAEAVLEGYGLNTGEALRATIADINKMDQSTIDWMKDVLSREFQMKFN